MLLAQGLGTTLDKTTMIDLINRIHDNPTVGDNVKSALEMMASQIFPYRSADPDSRNEQDVKRRIQREVSALKAVESPDDQSKLLELGLVAMYSGLTIRQPELNSAGMLAKEIKEVWQDTEE